MVGLPGLQERPLAWKLSLGSELATPWEGLKPQELCQPGEGEREQMQACFPSAICGCGLMATFQSHCRSLATTDF